MDEFAIQQDATGTTEAQQETTAPNDGQQQTAAVSPREAAMAAIEDQIARQREEEGAAVPAEVPAQQAGGSAAPSDDRQQDRQAAPAAADPSQPPERLLTVKIDGVEMQIPESQVIRGFQKDQTASRRLEEAAHLRKELDERERLVREKEQQAAAGEAAPSRQEQENAGGEAADALARKIMDGLLEGNLDEAAQALAAALKGTSSADATPVVDASAVEEIVQRELSSRELEADYQRAKEMFDTTFADINGNPRMAQLCNDIYFEHLEAGRRPSEAAKLAGDEVRALFAPPVPPQSSRQERKQGIDSITPAAAPVAAPGTDAASNDPNAVIAEMRRARGQT